jgi:hypothetical protein
MTSILGLGVESVTLAQWGQTATDEVIEEVDVAGDSAGGVHSGVGRLAEASGPIVTGTPFSALCIRSPRARIARSIASCAGVLTPL